ncbi:MAG: PaaI family thioesterase [Candidatus Aminicenantes bacterium]|nr:PaaI family thioesterase [Candidatus Aminicenantes bacterium]
MSEFTDDHHCFVCGQENPAGLKLAFSLNPQSGEVEADVVFPSHLQGWQDTVHGGLLATVLDESMIKAAAAAGHKCVSAEITVTYKRPAATGKAYRVAAWVVEARGRIVRAESRLCDGSGQVLAQATEKLYRV